MPTLALPFICGSDVLQGYDTSKFPKTRVRASAALVSKTLIAVLGGYPSPGHGNAPTSGTGRSFIDVLDTATHTWASVDITPSGVSSVACGQDVVSMGDYGVAAEPWDDKLYIWDSPDAPHCDSNTMITPPAASYQFMYSPRVRSNSRCSSLEAP